MRLGLWEGGEIMILVGKQDPQNGINAKSDTLFGRIRDTICAWPSFMQGWI